MRISHRFWLAGLLGLWCLLVAWASYTGDRASAQPSDFERIQASCRTFHSYFVTAVHLEATSAQPRRGEPAIVAFRDVPDGDNGDTITLATQDQVGTIYGLAYDAVHGRLYAAAYHKRATAFGPGGPGQIYEVDLASGRVRPFVRLSAGADRHDYRNQRDEPAAAWVGRTGLGDLEVDEAGTQLFAMNLTEGRIYRLRLPDGQILGSFRHGAAEEPWTRNAQPFGLAYADGWLYHGVVNSLMFGGSPDQFAAYVYRSRPDGSEMTLVAEFALDYPRGSVIAAGWAAWDNRVPAPMPSGEYPSVVSQPMLVDLELPLGGQLVVGLRDRMADMLPVLDRPAGFYRGVGDALLGLPEANRWHVITAWEHFEDGPVLDESTWGGLAVLPGFGLTVGASLAPNAVGGLGALWHWVESGSIANAETVIASYARADSNGLGDIESLCPRLPEPDPGAVPTATSAAVTATAGAPGTATAMASTPMPVASLVPHFDRIVADACLTDNPYAATVCYPYYAPLDAAHYAASTIFAFRDTPGDAPVYGVALWSSVGSTWGLAHSVTRSELYAGAYHKRSAAFGRGGPGGIYRISLATGRVERFTTVPNPGPDAHSIVNIRSPDTAARDWVGKLSLGDLDLSSDEGTLFVVNLNDRRIYRFDAVSGELLGSFDHGAAGESWADDARPFGLKYFNARLYHGVVNSAESSQRREDLAAYVYESQADGSGMRQVARVSLDYERGTVLVPGVLGGQAGYVPLTWLPWRDGDNDLSAARVMISIYPQPMLTDIEFRPNGDMILGLRDRHADMTHGFQIVTPTIRKPGIGFGDVLLVPRQGHGWGEAVYNHFQNLGGAAGGRAGMGGLAGHLQFPFVLANRVTFAGSGAAPAYAANVAREVLWYDVDGNAARLEQPCGPDGWYAATTLCGTTRTRDPSSAGLPARLPMAARPAPARRALQSAEPMRLLHNEYVAGRSMGDVEILCGPYPTSSPSPTSPTPTPRPTRTPTATSTVKPSSTPSRTPSATPRPRPIHLPIAIRIPCVPTGLYSDVALVIDVSTSMSRQTPAGRSKLAATIEAARWFVGRMEHLAPDALGNHEQVAVVGFNRSAWIEQELTNDPLRLARALDRLERRLAEYTRLDLAVRVGAEATGGRNHRPANGQVIILLTDGLPNQVPVDPDGTMETTVLKAAQAAKEAGNRIYTIAIGAPQDTSPELLRGIASGSDHYFYMPDPEELEKVYDAIYQSIPCAPGGPRWP